MDKMKVCGALPKELSLFFDFSKWNRRLLFVFGILTILSTIAKLTGLLFGSVTLAATLTPIHFIASFLLIILTIIIGFINKKLKKNNNYLMIIYISLYTIIMSLTHGVFVDFRIGFLLIYCLSVYYFDKKLLLFSTLSYIIGYTICIIVFVHTLSSIIANIAFMITIVCIIYFVFSSIIERVNDVVYNLFCSLQTQQKLLIEKTILEHAAKFDALTNLYNHKIFHEYMFNFVEQNYKNNLPVQLAILDIDFFKKINDTYGHSIGDIILKTVAYTINNSVTKQDVVARYGGEEFAVIFINKTLTESVQILEQIRKQISNINFKEIDWHITISTGINEHVKGENKDISFNKADAALYYAKEHGRNQVITYQNKIPLKHKK